MDNEIEWASQDPQQWSRYWSAHYQLEGGKVQTVEGHSARKEAAVANAKAGMRRELEKVAAVGIPTKGRCWVEEHQSRSQHRKEVGDTLEELVTVYDGSKFTVALPGWAKDYGRPVL